jgi:hypothetical protein
VAQYTHSSLNKYHTMSQYSNTELPTRIRVNRVELEKESMSKDSLNNNHEKLPQFYLQFFS